MNSVKELSLPLLTGEPNDIVPNQNTEIALPLVTIEKENEARERANGIDVQDGKKINK